MSYLQFFAKVIFNAMSEKKARQIIDTKIIKTHFNKNNVVTIKTNKILAKILLLGSLNKSNDADARLLLKKLKLSQDAEWLQNSE